MQRKSQSKNAKPTIPIENLNRINQTLILIFQSNLE
jgi:hypothetical protein